MREARGLGRSMGGHHRCGVCRPTRGLSRYAKQFEPWRMPARRGSRFLRLDCLIELAASSDPSASSGKGPEPRSADTLAQAFIHRGRSGSSAAMSSGELQFSSRHARRFPCRCTFADPSQAVAYRNQGASRRREIVTRPRGTLEVSYRHLNGIVVAFLQRRQGAHTLVRAILDTHRPEHVRAGSPPN
jgi:hypothetical protein